MVINKLRWEMKQLSVAFQSKSGKVFEDDVIVIIIVIVTAKKRINYKVIQ